MLSLEHNYTLSKEVREGFGRLFFWHYKQIMIDKSFGWVNRNLTVLIDLECIKHIPCNASFENDSNKFSQYNIGSFIASHFFF